ncbi:MAG: hypothetical protein V3V39_07795 [Desulfobacterales bacterium]
MNLIRSGIKIPSEAQWLRCRPPINAHIPMYAALSRSACALPLNLIWGFETTSIKVFDNLSDNLYGKHRFID